MLRSSRGSRTTKFVLATAGAVSATALVLAGCSSSAKDAANETTPEGQSAAASESASGSAPAAVSPSATASAKAKASASASAKASESASPAATSSATSSSNKAKKPSSSYNMSGGKTKTKPASKPSKKPSYTINPRITVSKSKGLKDGEYVTVSGTGFDNTKGIYIALCVVTGGKPTPCGGGVDTDGSENKSEWISSNPPTYGSSLAKPYGPNGSFSVRIKVSDKIGSFDCKTGGCAIFTKADHTRASDRSLDRFVRVTFA